MGGWLLPLDLHGWLATDGVWVSLYGGAGAATSMYHAWRALLTSIMLLIHSFSRNRTLGVLIGVLIGVLYCSSLTC